MRTKKAIIAQLHSLSTRVYKFCRNKLQVPVVCILCNKYLKEHGIICPSCYELLPILSSTCNICCAPLHNNQESVCSECQESLPQFTKIYSGFLYAEPLQSLIHTFKYHEGLYLQTLLTNLLSEAPIAKKDIGVVMPVPLAKKKLQQRGFNQAALLGKGFAKKLNVAYSDKYLQKITHTKNQADLDKAQRKINLTNAFACRDLPFKNVTLVDDIVTTGSTVNEISKVLRMHGAEVVNVCCVARAGRRFFKDLL